MGCTDAPGDSFRDWKDTENEVRAEQVEDAGILDKALNVAAEEGRDRQQDKEIEVLSDVVFDEDELCHEPPCWEKLNHVGPHIDHKGDPIYGNRKPVNDLPTGTGEFDAVARPAHYNDQVPPTDKHPNGIECIDVIMHFALPIGSAMKYLWRAGQKGDYIEDLDKAIAFIEFAKYKELQRRKREKSVSTP